MRVFQVVPLDAPGHDPPILDLAARIVDEFHFGEVHQMRDNKLVIYRICQWQDLLAGEELVMTSIQTIRPIDSDKMVFVVPVLRSLSG